MRAVIRIGGAKVGRVVVMGLLVLTVANWPKLAVADEPSFAFLAPSATMEELGPEARAAWQLAEELSSVELILPAEDGKFVNRKSRPVSRRHPRRTRRVGGIP